MEKQHDPRLLAELHQATINGAIKPYESHPDWISFQIKFSTPLDIRTKLEDHIKTKYPNYKIQKSFINTAPPAPPAVVVLYKLFL